MSKTKQYYSDNAENQVDQILAHMKSGQIDEDKAKIPDNYGSGLVVDKR